MTEKETIQIDGEQLSLSDGRSVWAGKADDGSWYFQFRNGDLLTKLRLSQEATDALCLLVSRHNAIDEIREATSLLRFVYKMNEMEWSQISENAEASSLSPDR